MHINPNNYHYSLSIVIDSIQKFVVFQINIFHSNLALQKIPPRVSAFWGYSCFRRLFSYYILKQSACSATLVSWWQGTTVLIISYKLQTTNTHVKFRCDLPSPHKHKKKHPVEYSLLGPIQATASREDTRRQHEVECTESFQVVVWTISFISTKV